MSSCEDRRSSQETELKPALKSLFMNRALWPTLVHKGEETITGIKPAKSAGALCLCIVCGNDSAFGSCASMFAPRSRFGGAKLSGCGWMRIRRSDRFGAKLGMES